MYLCTSTILWLNILNAPQSLFFQIQHHLMVTNHELHLNRTFPLGSVTGYLHIKNIIFNNWRLSLHPVQGWGPEGLKSPIQRSLFHSWKFLVLNLNPSNDFLFYLSHRILICCLFLYYLCVSQSLSIWGYCSCL